MKGKLKKQLNTISHGLGAVLALFAATSCYMLYTNFSSQEKLWSAKDGLSVCFTRVQQAYSAKVLSSSQSSYLSSDFFRTTEECYADALQMLSHLKLKGKEVVDRVNDWATDVHWFHDKIESDRASALSASPRDLVFNHLSDRFTKLENLRDEVFSLLEQVTAQKQDQILYWSLGLGVVFLLSLTLLCLSFALTLKTNRFRNEIELRAKEETDKYGALVSRDFFEMADRVFDHFGLSTAKIWSQQLAENIESNNVIRTQAAPETSRPLSSKEQVLFLDKAQANDESIDKVWDQPEPVKPKKISFAKFNNGRTEKAVEEFETSNDVVRSFEEADDVRREKDRNFDKKLKGVNLDKIATKVVGLISKKIFGQGITISIDIDEDIWVEAREEALEQVFYQLINNAVEACSHVISPKSVYLSAKKLGGSVIVHIDDTGIGFSDSFLRIQNGLGKDSTSEDGIGIEVCKEFMRDFAGQISFENIRKDKVQIQGARVKLLFRVGSRQPYVSRVQKGKKKDLQKHLQVQQ